MKRKQGLFFVILGLLIFSFIGCEKLNLKFPLKKEVFKPEGTVIAQVDNMYITLEQLNQEIENYNKLMEDLEAKITTREQKLAYLNEELIRRYLLYQEAKARGLDKEPKNQELLRNVEINLLANQLLQAEIGNLVVTSSEIEDFYNLYKEQYRQEEERRIREIVLDSETEAREALIELLKGADFASLATQRSRSESARQGGDLGFVKKGQRGSEFARFDEVAFSPFLEVGQVSNVFKDKRGYYIIKVEGIKGGQARALSEVWDEIKRSVLFLKQQQKLREMSSSLLKKAKVEIYEEKIK